MKNASDPDEDLREGSGQKDVAPAQDQCHQNDKREKNDGIGVEAERVGVVLSFSVSYWELAAY